MSNADDIDAMQLLRALARSHPQGVDLTFLAWELGFSDARIKHAVGALRIVGAVDPPHPGDMLTGLATLSHRGLDLARVLGMPIAPNAGERRLSGGDRRRAQMPIPGNVERRSAARDRRI